MNKVCFISLCRSDYSSLAPVIKAAVSDDSINVNVVAGGSHLLKRFGASISNFREDGIKIDKIIDFLKEEDDTNIDIARAFGKLYLDFLEYLTETSPNYVFILGDRWEMLAIANAASLLKIPIIHHSGGDLTQGSMDNQTRYAISTLAHIHLVALEEHRQRLIQMGEEEWRVLTVGEPALIEINKFKDENFDIRKELGINAHEKFILATFHPTSFVPQSACEQIDIFLDSLLYIPETIIFTAPNPDSGSHIFYSKVHQFTLQHQHIRLYENLGTKRYYACMDQAEYMIGNSSSGIWEAPSFKLPVINIGDRQKDRHRAENVIDSPLNLDDIKMAIKKASSEDFRKRIKNIENPYILKNTINLIINSLKSRLSKEKILAKSLIDPLLK